MTTQYHDPIEVGESNSPDTINTRLGDLDNAITVQFNVLDDRIDDLIVGSGTSDAETIAARTAINYKTGSPPATLGAALTHAALDVANVRAFGAVGDGVTDDSAAIQSACTNHEIVYFPPGDYVCNDVDVPANRLLFGNSSVTIIPNVASGYSFNLNGDNIIVRGLSFAGADADENALLVNLDSANLDNIHIEDCSFTSLYIAINIKAVTQTGRTITGLHVERCRFVDLEFRAVDMIVSTVGGGVAYTLENIHIENCHFEDVAEESSGGGFGGAIYIGGQTATRRFYLCNNVVFRAGPQFLAMSDGAANRADFVITGNMVRQEGTVSVIHMGFQCVDIQNLLFADNSVYYVEYESLFLSNCKNFKVLNCHFEDANIGVSINDNANAERSNGVIVGCTFTDIECPTSENNGNKAIYMASDGGSVAVTGCSFQRVNGAKAQFGADIAYANTSAGTNAKWARVFDTTNFAWTATTGSRYYLQLNGNTNPHIAMPTNVYENGTALTAGTIGSLTAGQWAYGDNNSLGYTTIYVRLSDSTQPTSNEVSAGYPHTDMNFSNCYFQGMTYGINVSSGGNSSYPGNASVMNCSFTRCFTGVNFNYAYGNTVTGCVFQTCDTDIRSASDVNGFRCSRNYHINTNPSGTSTQGAVVVNVGTGYSIWEVSGSTFQNVKNIHVIQSGAVSPRKRMLIYRDNIEDANCTGSPAGSSISVITAITATNKILGAYDSAPSAGSDWSVGDIILNSNVGSGENIGWMLTGASYTTAGILNSQVGYRSGSGAPSANAQFIGEEYLDSTNNKWYKSKATGTGSSDWVALN